jgi:cell division septal protein FtsQ
MKKFLAVLIIIFLGLLGFGVTKIRILEISCQSQYGPCSERIAGLVDSYKGGKWYSVKKGLDEGLVGDGQVEEFSVRYKIPNKLEVNLIESKAEVALINEGGEKYVLVSRSGAVLGEAEVTQLPKILIKDEGVGDDERIFAVKILDELFVWKGVKSGVISDGGLQVDLNNGVKTIFPLNGDVDVLLGSANLVLLWLNSQAQDTRISLVDLRYKNPVIK